MITRSVTRMEMGAATQVRLLMWLALVIAEMLVVSLLFDFTAGIPAEHNPVYYVTRAARWAAIGVPMFVIVAWTQRQRLMAQWASFENSSFLGRPLAINLLLFALTAAAAALFTANAAVATTPPWHLLPVLGALLAGMALSQIAVVIPLRSLGLLINSWRREAAVAGGAALAVVMLADAATHLWDRMAQATLVVSAAILRLYETDVLVDTVERGIRVGDFGVAIWHTCSGFEGLALVGGFVTIYLWTFRQELRFPRALLLYPIGLGASWLLNAVRIAALVSIGAHVSPEMAVKGFHSQAGWIAFLFVALGLMGLSRHLGLTRNAMEPAKPGTTSREGSSSLRYRATVGHLMPFVALMIGSIAMSVAAPHDRPVYALKAALVAGALWLFRRSYGSWAPALPVMSTVAGLAVGSAWIATAPVALSESGLGQWLIQIGPFAAMLWLLTRGIGTIILVPVAEELAFRGYLYRRIMGRDFHMAGCTAFSWLALAISSIAFGMLHDRWIAGALAGAVFAVVMVRGGRIGDAMIAHGIANALIFGWALAFREWSLL
ncbi:MAG: exosortase E/protease, VPEID-CTERM system [Hyphomicrobiaceae bacterium]